MAFAGLSGCAAGSYAGVNLGQSAAPAPVQVLARTAKSGDKAAQFKLAELYERGDGLPKDLTRAEWLYREAASDKGGNRTVLMLLPSGTVAAVNLNAGPQIVGLDEARDRLWTERPKSPQMRPTRRHSPQPVSQTAELFREAWFAIPRSLGQNFACTIEKKINSLKQCRKLPHDPRKVRLASAAYLSDFVAGIDGSLHCREEICRLNGARTLLVEIDHRCEFTPAVGIIRARGSIVAAEYVCGSEKGQNTSSAAFVDAQALTATGISIDKLIQYVNSRRDK